MHSLSATQMFTWDCATDFSAILLNGSPELAFVKRGTTFFIAIFISQAYKESQSLADFNKNEKGATFLNLNSRVRREGAESHGVLCKP